MPLAEDYTYFPDAPPTFGYILVKSAAFLKLGPDQYLKGDFFGLPRQDLEGEVLGLVTSGFSQFLDGRG